jgi:hypothetical protein
MTGRREIRHLIRNRIRNCVLVAQHISSSHNSAHEQELFKDFCNAASTSRCCWHYIFGLRYVDSFVPHVDENGDPSKESELRLEAALLIANGYQLADVKQWLLRLGKLGMLVGYRENTVHFDGSHVRCWMGTKDICTEVSISYQEIDVAKRAVEENREKEVDEELEELEREIVREAVGSA